MTWAVVLVKISTHALREEGDDLGQGLHLVGTISTHALREEGDPPCGAAPLPARIFLPTPSVRRATGAGDVPLGKVYPISTHALREEGDTSGPRRRTWPRHFYPRPP